MAPTSTRIPRKLDRKKTTPMGRYKGRSTVACHTCHALKVKCSGSIPCQRCRTRGHECTYPVRDRLLAVPESYLRHLERDVHRRGGGSDISTGDGPSSQPALSHPEEATPPASSVQERSRLLEDCSAERFVEKLRELSLSTTIERPVPEQSPQSPVARHTYARLNFDVIHSEVSFKLPPRPYAFHLLDIFEEGFCDYHWYLRNRFRHRLSLTYSNPSSQAHDRNWLCRVSVVMALAISWGRSRTPAGSDEGSSASSDELLPHSPPPLPPGSDFFEQGLLLLKMSLEEPVLEDIEALNLIAFYCYSLNRRKSAYFYAGQSLRLATLLGLDAFSSSGTIDLQGAGEDRLDSEHKRRVWWTCYCMDRMVSTELGLPAVHHYTITNKQFPSSSGLTPAEQEEFFNPHLLAAQAQLCSIKGTIVETVTNLRIKDFERSVDAIRPCLDTLQMWRQGLPPDMSFTFEQGIPSTMLDLPFTRILASLYLRYHQCFILLLRPLFLPDLSSSPIKNNINSVGSASGSDVASASPDADDWVMSMKLECLHAARYNSKILVDLWRIGKIAKFGYWESLHLFSGLAILSLSRAVTFPGRPVCGWRGGEEDHRLYTQACCVLEDMAHVGSPAARDHKALLADVEDMVETLLRERERKAHDSQSADSGERRQDVSPTALAGAYDDQMWLDMDWESIFMGWTESA